MSEVKKTGLDLMRVPFEANQISLLPKPTKKDNPKGVCKECNGYHGLPAVHIQYVGHAALTDRLLEADQNWTWEPMYLKEGLPAFDSNGGLWIKLTVCGVTRLGYGNAEESIYNGKGSREKEVIGDALRNAGMRFGAALDLWHKGDLHIEDNTQAKKEIKTPDKLIKDNPPSPHTKNTPLVNHAPQVFAPPSDSPLPSLEDELGFGADPRVGDDKLNYQITFGKHAGKTISDVGIDVCHNYAKWLKDSNQKSGKPMTESVKNFCEVVESL